MVSSKISEKRERKGGGSAAGGKNKVFARRRRAENAKNEQKVRNFGPNLGFLEIQIFTSY